MGSVRHQLDSLYSEIDLLEHWFQSSVDFMNFSVIFLPPPVTYTSSPPHLENLNLNQKYYWLFPHFLFLPPLVIAFTHIINNLSFKVLWPAFFIANHSILAGNKNKGMHGYQQSLCTHIHWIHSLFCCPLQPLISCWNQKMGDCSRYIHPDLAISSWFLSERSNLLCNYSHAKGLDSKPILPIACEHLTLVDEMLCKSISSEKQSQVQPSSEQKSDCSQVYLNSLEVMIQKTVLYCHRCHIHHPLHYNHPHSVTFHSLNSLIKISTPKMKAQLQNLKSASFLTLTNFGFMWENMLPLSCTHPKS